MKTLIKLIFTVCVLLNVNDSKAQNYIFDWVRPVEGISMSNAIDIDASGNVYATGHFNETADFDPGAGIYNLTAASTGYADIFIQKLDANGNFIWAKSIGATGGDFGHSITVDASGDIYITGNFSGTVDFDPGTGTYHLTAVGYADVFVLKLDANGNFIWAKSMGGTYSAVGYSIETDALGNVYTTGIFQGIADFDPGTGIYDLNSENSIGVFIQKMDVSGNFLWAKAISSFTTDSTGAINYGFSLTVDSLGNIYITGSFTGTADFDPGANVYNLTAMGIQDIFIQKLDADGNFLWAKSMGGTSYDAGFSITADSYGNIYTTGTFENTVDFDPGTGAHNITAAGLNDIFIQKLDPEGHFLWTKTIGSTSYEKSHSITTDNESNIYITGYFSETMDFDPGTGTYNLTAMGLEDIFIQKLDTDGHFIWAKSMGGTAYEMGNAIKVDASGNVYTTGYFSGATDFDPGTGTEYLLATGGLHNAFIQKLKDSVENIGISPPYHIESINFYPNPTSGNITVKGNEIQYIIVTDIHGRIIQQISVLNATTEINLSREAKGLYFLKIKTEDQIIIKKVLLK